MIKQAFWPSIEFIKMPAILGDKSSISVLAVIIFGLAILGILLGIISLLIKAINKPNQSTSHLKVSAKNKPVFSICMFVFSGILLVCGFIALICFPFQAQLKNDETIYENNDQSNQISSNLQNVNAPDAKLTAFKNRINAEILQNPAYSGIVNSGALHFSVEKLGANDQKYCFASDTKIVSASMIKMLILAEFMEQVDAGQLSLNATHVLKGSELSVGGTGFIGTNYSVGQNITWDRLAYYMITYSDNAATNILIDQLGMAAINGKAQKLGLNNTSLNRKMMEAGKENYTSIDDLNVIFREIYNHSIASAAICDTAISYLNDQTDQDCFGSVFKTFGITYGHKTGILAKGAGATVRLDGGIVFVSSPFLITGCIELSKTEAEPIFRAIAKIAAETLC